ncbi:MAG: biopolymer transporter ExbD [Holophaga sp.]|nr:biopolymer transporter ExbD [Holophaga sp.]
MDAGGSKGKAKSEINVTPLIDVVLVLLIVFIVLLPGLTKALPVAVPRVVKTSAPPPDPHNPPLVVSVDEKGGLLLQSDRIELPRLADALVPVVLLQPAGMRRVFLKVDGGQPWQKVVDVLDQIRLASERARSQTAARPEWGGRDGGDIKVAITLRR